MDRGDVFGDPRGEGGEQAFACGGNPGEKIGLGPFSDHGVKAIGECSRGDQRRHTGLDSCYGDGIGFVSGNAEYRNKTGVSGPEAVRSDLSTAGPKLHEHTGCEHAAKAMHTENMSPPGYRPERLQG